jgi:hypothetical protein
VRAIVPGDRESQQDTASVTAGAENSSESDSLRAPPLALAVEQILQHVECALLSARIALAVLEEVTVLVGVVARFGVEEAPVLEARELPAESPRSRVIAVLACHQEAERQRARVGARRGQHRQPALVPADRRDRVSVEQLAELAVLRTT